MDTHTVLWLVKRDLHLHNARLLGRLSITMGYSWCCGEFQLHVKQGYLEADRKGVLTTTTARNDKYTHNFNHLFSNIYNRDHLIHSLCLNLISVLTINADLNIREWGKCSVLGHPGVQP